VKEQRAESPSINYLSEVPTIDEVPTIEDVPTIDFE
jgi:hypothetical protein